MQVHVVLAHVAADAAAEERLVEAALALHRHRRLVSTRVSEQGGE